MEKQLKIYLMKTTFDDEDYLTVPPNCVSDLLWTGKAFISTVWEIPDVVFLIRDKLCDMLSLNH